MHKRVGRFFCKVFLLAPLCAGIAAEEGKDLVVSIEWEAIILPPTANDNEQQHRRFESFREAVAGESLQEAEITAKEMVEYTSSGLNIDLQARSRALHNLALIQHLRGDFDSAIVNFRTAIDAMTSDTDRLNEALVMPLRGLGAVYADAGQPVEALQSFDRALHISNVNEGPHSLVQLPILDAILQLHLEQDDVRVTLDVMNRIYLLHVRTYALDSMQLIPVLYNQAGVYRSFGMSAEERSELGRVAKIMRQHHGSSDAMLIDPYLQLGRNLVGELDKMTFRSGPTAPTAERYLKNALRIAEKNPEVGWLVRKKCLLALADYYSLVEMYARANRYYQQTWVFLSSDDAYLSRRAEDLEVNVPLSRPRPHPYANFEYNPDRDDINPDDYLPGEMTMRFTLTRQGRIKDVELVAADPPDFARMERRMRNALKKFKYRPRYVDGVAIEARQQQYTLNYQYLPSEYAASQAKEGKLGRPRPPQRQ